MGNIQSRRSIGAWQVEDQGFLVCFFSLPIRIDAPIAGPQGRKGPYRLTQSWGDRDPKVL